VYSDALAIVTAAVTGVVIFGLWYAVPLARLRRIS
jgi:hypothetical protein